MIRILPALLLAAQAALAAVRPGENLLANPIFESDQLEVPACWAITSGKEFYAWRANGGPRQLPAMRFSAKTPAGLSVRQGGMKLLEGGRYRLVCWLRAKDFAAKKAGLVVANAGWSWSDGIRFDRLSGGWSRHVADVTIASASRDGSWTAIFFADGFTGEIELADVSLTPLDAASAEGASLSEKAAAAEAPRLVPICPILSEIPDADRRIVFRYYGRLSEGTEKDCDVRLTTANGVSTRSLVREGTKVPLPKGSEAGDLTAAVVVRKTGKVLFERRFSYRVVYPPVRPTRGERLNNLVEEYVNRPLKSGGHGALKLAFARSVWLFVSADADSVTFDGREIIGPDVPRHEAFVEAGTGEHELAVTGANGGSLVVRRIPEVFDYVTFDPELQRRFVFPAVTTLSCGRIAPEDRETFRKTGHLWVGDIPTTELKDVDELHALLTTGKYADDPVYCGVCCDEQDPWKAKTMSDYARGLWEFRPERDFRVYSWVVGKPFLKAPNADMASAALNVSGGRGRFLNEIYCMTKPTEAEARAAARDWIVGNYRAWRELFPEMPCGYAPIFGSFTRFALGWSLAPHCEVDFRCLLDLAFNILVNDPELVDIPMTGLWGNNYADYCDKELNEWSFRLLRHYCIEGKREMLSRSFGLSYLPGHLMNGDFAEGLSGWTAEGPVRIETIAGFGELAEGRGGREKLTCGDTFAALPRGARVSRTAAGLEPGRWYVLDCLTFLTDDARANRADRTDPGISISVSGGEIVRTDRQCHDRGRGTKPAALVHVQTVVFTAAGREAKIVFSADGTPEGREAGLNCIGLRRSIRQ